MLPLAGFLCSYGPLGWRESHFDRLAEPPVGTRVFIRTRQQINGWEDAPKQTNALVPAP